MNWLVDANSAVNFITLDRANARVAFYNVNAGVTFNLSTNAKVAF